MKTKSSPWPHGFERDHRGACVARRLENIGFSAENRPLKVLLMGCENAPLRILLMSGQHGDEQEAVGAVQRFCSLYLPKLISGGRIQAAVVAKANPDGIALKSRLNAGRIDLNRDHQILRAKETRALHAFVHHWRPHLIIDVHNYPPRRRHLLKNGLVYCQDLLVDIPTNPNLTSGTMGTVLIGFLEALLADLRQWGFRCERYTLINSSGRVRHSTPDVNDVRNGISLRYSIPSILLEARQATRRDGPAMRQRAQTVILKALDFILGWAAQNLNSLPVEHSSPNDVVLRSRYVKDGSTRSMEFQDSKTGGISRITLPGPYTPNLKVTGHTELPLAYAVPAQMRELCELLVMHGFGYYRADPDQVFSLQSYYLGRVRPSRRLHRMPRRLTLEKLEGHRRLQGYLVYPVTADSGRALAVYLEPCSKYGLHRYSATGLTLRSGAAYPVLRLMGLASGSGFETAGQTVA